MSLEIQLSKIEALCVAGAWIEIDHSKEFVYDDEVELFDDQGEEIIGAETPSLAFTGKDGKEYIVSLAATAFRVKG